MSLSINTKKQICVTCKNTYTPATYEELENCSSCIKRFRNIEKKLHKQKEQWKTEYISLTTKRTQTSPREEELKKILEYHGINTSIPPIGTALSRKRVKMEVTCRI